MARRHAASGDSLRHWDGDTLVVETTNFTTKTSFSGSSRQLRLVERFTRIRDDRVLYEYTVDDAESFAAPWTAAIPMKRATSHCSSTPAMKATTA